MCQNRNERNRQWILWIIYPHILYVQPDVWQSELLRHLWKARYSCSFSMQKQEEASKTVDRSIPLLSNHTLFLLFSSLYRPQDFDTCCACSWGAFIQFLAWFLTFQVQLVASLEGTFLAMPVWNGTTPIHPYHLSLLVVHFLPETCHTWWQSYRIFGFC